MGKPSKISASMMCANAFALSEGLQRLEDGGVEYLHMDVMDGHFVPNLGMSIDTMKSIRRRTTIPFDFHIMAFEPDSIVPLLEPCEGDIVTIHVESTAQIQRTIERTRRFGCKVFAALNPATSLMALDELVHYVDGVNLMMVNPGFAGQRMSEPCIDKARRLRGFLEERGRGGIDVEVDGNISVEKAHLLRGLGADIFVVGTSSIFVGDSISPEAISALRAAIA